MNEELQFARGVYAATKMFIHGRLPSYELDDKTIKDAFKYIMRCHRYHEIRINELYEQCKSE